ncbi:MAG TPA: single-stranded DNA-binding protein [Bacillota bacterium]|nr:single-stranded DNA-binding protein [Bacillota bacterium]HOH10843.1 single-stranded DNA-binding protein [Bacillota bacterium]HOY88631.1 single-stranded DNA-binding protein [Bacillota bacterium]HPI00788.1 single-stranded DNA-binding protein [Bacillota bacterium]HPM63971.1 single-stranded DNA-binding protein [Bacillota bacterium]
MLNRVILIGRLTQDPVLSYTQSGKAVAKFTLAVDKGIKDQNGRSQADFIDIVVWDKQAENVSNYVKKGHLTAVEGRLQVRSYETQEGQKRRAWEVVANRVVFLEKRGEGGYSRGPQPQEGAPEEVDDEMGVEELADEPPF